MAATPPSKDKSLPTLEGYDLNTRLLVAVFNMLKLMDWHLLRVNGNKTPQPSLWPIPETAYEREMARQKQRQVDLALTALGVDL